MSVVLLLDKDRIVSIEGQDLAAMPVVLSNRNADLAHQTPSHADGNGEVLPSQSDNVEIASANIERWLCFDKFSHICPSPNISADPPAEQHRLGPIWFDPQTPFLTTACSGSIFRPETSHIGTDSVTLLPNMGRAI
jgi:hypothetical protein